MPCGGHGDRVEQLHALFRELVLERLPRRLVELQRIAVGRREERNAVEPVERILVLEVDQQDLADLRLAALHGALDLRRLEQRRVRVHGDLELAAGGLVDVVGELLDVLGVEVAGRIGRRHVPLGLGGHGQRERARPSAAARAGNRFIWELLDAGKGRRARRAEGRPRAADRRRFTTNRAPRRRCARERERRGEPTSPATRAHAASSARRRASVGSRQSPVDSWRRRRESRCCRGATYNSRGLGRAMLHPMTATPPRSSARRLGVLDRSRRHVHRCRRAPARRVARHAQAAVGEPRALSGCRGARDPRAAGPRAGRADSAGRRRRGEDGHDGRHQRAARAQGRAHGARHHAGLRRRAADRLPESAEALRAEDRAADAAVRARDRGRRADRRARRDRASARSRVRAARACRGARIRASPRSRSC